MGLKYGQGHYYGTRGSIIKTFYKVSTKKEAIDNTYLLPDKIKDSAKSFFQRGSSKYEEFTASLDTSNNYILVMEKPGNVPGSRAVYFKIIDSDGKSRVYKETYDPAGNLIHTKNK